MEHVVESLNPQHMGKLIPEMTRGFQVSQAYPGKDGLEHGLKTMTRVRVSQLQHCQNPPEALLKYKCLGPTPKSDSGGFCGALGER